MKRYGEEARFPKRGKPSKKSRRRKKGYHDENQKPYRGRKKEPLFGKKHQPRHRQRQRLDTYLNKKKVFVRNIPLEAEKTTIDKNFSNCGIINEIVLFGKGGPSWRGMGLVEFSNEDEAALCIDTWDGKPIYPWLDSALGVEYFRELLKKRSERNRQNYRFHRRNRREFDHDEVEHMTTRSKFIWTNLKVYHLSPKTTKATLERVFEPFGTLIYANIVQEQSGEYGSKMNKVGYIQYQNSRDCAKALEYLNGSEIDSVRVTVKIHHRVTTDFSSNWMYGQQFFTGNMVPFQGSGYYPYTPSFRPQGGYVQSPTDQQMMGGPGFRGPVSGGERPFLTGPERKYYTDSYSTPPGYGRPQANPGGMFYPTKRMEYYDGRVPYSSPLPGTSLSQSPPKQNEAMDEMLREIPQDGPEFKLNVKMKKKKKPSNLTIEDKKNLFVFHLPQAYDDDALFALYKEFGDVRSVKVIRDGNGHSKGYGFVMYNNEPDAALALDETNGLRVMNKYLKVSYKTQKKKFFKKNAVMLDDQFQEQLEDQYQQQMEEEGEEFVEDEEDEPISQREDFPKGETVKMEPPSQEK